MEGPRPGLTLPEAIQSDDPCNKIAQSQILLVEGEFGRIDGSLAVNLRNETLAARLLPDMRLMGVIVRTPVTTRGTLAVPRVGVEPGAALAQLVGDTVANRLWRSSAIEFLRGATGSTSPGGDCAAALTLARLGRAGRMPEAAATPIRPLARDGAWPAHLAMLRVKLRLR